MPDLFGHTRRHQRITTPADKVRRALRRHQRATQGKDTPASTVATELRMTVEQVVELFRESVRYPVTYQDAHGAWWLFEDGE